MINTSQTDNRTLPDHLTILKEFFQTDKASEIIASLNQNIESILFTENLNSITPEMRVNITNQLRVATLLSKLEGCLKEVS
ncbi:hypothetical protein [Dyadobacter chenhuakuii]|uniref:Uncharacterized protein n=1 Tax=Dyadobacter chenhuakuii TaxID=2909339 RepID=A0ABY4XJC0_9BACT|nr:hypothetical protein [Dyadobacter chenhuakuii]MCF2496279.1 hypothetical protein [Dyadobacter chenhuakuii]USJ30339.1 hypothetical protein NFI80_21060 [Dyadobacter chenhuakuii]